RRAAGRAPSGGPRRVGARLRAQGGGAGEVGARARPRPSHGRRGGRGGRRRVSEPLRLRHADAHDVDPVAAIEALAFSDPWSRSSFASLLGNPQVLFAVADAEGAGPGRDVVGYVVAWFAADEAEIANIAVAPSARGRGVGA